MEQQDHKGSRALPKFEMRFVEKAEDLKREKKEEVKGGAKEQKEEEVEDDPDTDEETEDFDPDAVYTRGGSGFYGPPKIYWVVSLTVAILGILLHKTSRDLGHYKKIRFNDQGCSRFETPTAIEDLAPLGDGHCGE